MRNAFTLSEAGVRNINRTIQSVNRMKVSGPQGDLPFRQNPKRQTSSSSTSIQIGKTKAKWEKGDEATIDVWKKDGAGGMEPSLKEDGTAITFKAYNLFVNVEAKSFVACVGGWLVAAECEGE